MALHDLGALMSALPEQFSCSPAATHGAAGEPDQPPLKLPVPGRPGDQGGDRTQRNDHHTHACADAPEHSKPHRSVADADDGNGNDRTWANLPQDLLAAILAPGGPAGRESRLVCRAFREAHDAGVRRATLRLPLAHAPAAARPAAASATTATATASAAGQELPRSVPQAGSVVALDAAHMELACHDLVSGPFDLRGLCGALRRWPLAAPLELDLSGNHIDAHGAELLAGALRCPTFAPGGLQALDLSCNPLGDGATPLAAALCAAGQTSALRALRLSRYSLSSSGAAALASALSAATHVRHLTLLDLSANDLRPQGVAALSACLRTSTHITASLEHLALADTCMGADDTTALAAAVVEASIPSREGLPRLQGGGLRLRSLELGHNAFGDAGAAAWAAALAASPHLASSLEELDLGGNDVMDAGMARLADALQGAAGMRLTCLVLFPARCGAAGADRAARLLRDSPHLSSVRELALCFGGPPAAGAAAGDACAVVWRAALASPHLSRLRSLDLSGCHIGSGGGDGGACLRHLCAALRAATHLGPSLEELDLRDNDLTPLDLDRLEGALAASTHLSRLRRLAVGSQPLAAPARMAGLLREAPHLRGLTALAFRGDVAQGGLSGLRAALELLPRLRALSLEGLGLGGSGSGSGSGGSEAGGSSGSANADVAEVAAALARAPCAPALEELAVGWCHGLRGDAGSALAALAGALRAATRVTALRTLALSFPQLSDSSCAAVLGVLPGAVGHMPALQELRLAVSGERQANRVLRYHLADRIAHGRGGRGDVRVVLL